ncbi:MAG: DnaJ domain-containing protein [Deltaproteobacteria bacterium]|nr:DnaJ domain-containing protein [Deltaproteobacteria bacterium]
MAELARGTVLDRPWGRTLSALASKGLTGEVTVIADAKPYVIAFHEGVVVAASSPLASDAAVRVALTGHLVSSTQVADIVRKQASAPKREEIEVLAEAARLTPDQAMRLRRRVLAQRAARTFALDRGDFIIDDSITLPMVPGSELDIRTVVYLGAKQFVSETRLNSELAQLGTWFQLKPETLDDLPQFGFGEPEQAVVERLIQGAGVGELERRDLELRMVRAVIYALVCSNMCITEPNARPVKKTTQPPAPRSRVQEAVDSPTIPRASMADATTQRRRPTTLQPAPAPAAVTVDAPTTIGRKKSATQAPAARLRVDDAQTLAAEALIQTKLALLDKHVDHYALLAISRDATAAQVRTAYFALARQLHPDRLSSLGIVDEGRRAQRLFAELNTAFAVLSDSTRRDEYTSILQRGGAKAIRAEQAKADEITQRMVESEGAYRKGEGALRRDDIETAIRELTLAAELNPDEADYHATLAWARFCGAPDKMASAHPTRVMLQKAIQLSPKAVTARFYLGRVERIIGRDQEALRYFREVLDAMPHHVDAGSEVRALEARMNRPKR